MDRNPPHEQRQRGVFVSSPSPSLSLREDPPLASFGTAWMRGITVGRLGVLALVYVIICANTPDLIDLPLGRRISFGLWIALRHFASALPGFVLVVKTEIWTQDSRPRT